VRVLTTDSSSSLKKLLRDVNAELRRRKLAPIKHTYDVWHMVRAVIKDCIIAVELKKCQTLASWIKSLRNMWYCFFAGMESWGMTAASPG
jgi:transposase-like protein